MRAYTLPLRTFKKENLMFWSLHVWGTSHSENIRHPNQSSCKGIRLHCASQTAWGKNLPPSLFKDGNPCDARSQAKNWLRNKVVTLLPLVILNRKSSGLVMASSSRLHLSLIKPQAGVTGMGQIRGRGVSLHLRSLSILDSSGDGFFFVSKTRYHFLSPRGNYLGTPQPECLARQYG